MRRALVVGMILSLIVGALIAPAEAGKKKKKKKAPVRVERVAEAEYQAPAFGSPDSGGVCLNASNSCANIATGGEDRYVKVTVEDATGTATGFTLGQDTDPATVGTETIYGDFCGTTGDTAIQLAAPGVELLSFVWAFGAVTCPGGFGTTGKVVATFSNMP